MGACSNPYYSRSQLGHAELCFDNKIFHQKYSEFYTKFKHFKQFCIFTGRKTVELSDLWPGGNGYMTVQISNTEANRQ